MRILADKKIRDLMRSLFIVMILFDILLQAGFYALYGKMSAPAALLSICLTGSVLLLCFRYFKKQDEILENAADRMNRFLSGETDARIECDEDGELYSLFHSVNTLSSVLNAQTEKEKQRNEFLKTTISDISHQLKTPLAALNIYNGLIADADSLEDVRHFSKASEDELDRMDNLVKNLLKLTRLDAGAITIEKHPENIADIMADLRQRFLYRAELEGKEIRLEGEDCIFECDAAWLSEALGNIVKNALDHTKEDGIITISWSQHGGIQNIQIKDNGCGIHPDDIHYIFKRFYRSRFSKDTQGIGLGLPLAKAIIDAHGGTIEVESEPGRGTAFSINFLILTKL